MPAGQGAHQAADELCLLKEASGQNHQAVRDLLSGLVTDIDGLQHSFIHAEGLAAAAAVSPVVHGALLLGRRGPAASELQPSRRQRRLRVAIHRRPGRGAANSRICCQRMLCTAINAEDAAQLPIAFVSRCSCQRSVNGTAPPLTKQSPFLF